ncbi:MAG TPA: TetR/AcrR family transcriptional regulator [Solirubrobacterales bacterium]
MPHAAPARVAGTDFSAQRLPRGRHGLPASYVAENQRWRLLGAAAEVFAERGYARTSSHAIADRAGVSRTTFYRNFADVDSCLLAAHEVAADCLWELASAAFAGAGEWPERLRAALEAAIDFLLSEPTLACLLGAELPAGVVVAVPARERLLERLAGLLREGRPQSLQPGHEPPPNAELHLIAAIFVLLGDRVADGDLESLPALTPELTEIVGIAWRQTAW